MSTNYQHSMNARRNAERELGSCEATLTFQKESLAAGNGTVTTEDLMAATFAVQRAELLLSAAVEAEKKAKVEANASDNMLAEFTRDVFAVNAVSFGLHDAKILVSKAQPPKEDITGKMLVISQHENTEIHGNGEISGRVTAVGYGGVMIDHTTWRKVFGQYGKVEFGNVPTYDFRYSRITPPEPVVTQPSGERLAAIFARKAEDVIYTFDANGRWVSRASGVDIYTHVLGDELSATAEGDTITVEGAVDVWTPIRERAYGVNELTAHMQHVIDGYGIGTAVAGIGVVEACEMTDTKPIENGVRVSFKATGKRKVLA